MVQRIKFMNICIDNVNVRECLEWVKNTIEFGNHEYVVTPNVDHLVKLQGDKTFLDSYLNAGLVAVDGTPIIKTAKFYKTPLKEKITGPRLADAVIQMAEKEGFTIFILGGKPGVADLAKQKLENKYPNLKVLGTYSPVFGFEKDINEKQKIVSLIETVKPQIIIAGMGSPKTEKFLYEIKKSNPANVTLSVGAALDFFAGTVKRCPMWINRIGFEWLYRFFKEPCRMFRRYFVDDIKYVKLIFKYKPKYEKAKKSIDDRTKSKS